jgi:AcrR family transcriptional regulator
VKRRTQPRSPTTRAVRERQLLDLAEELFAERGFRGASMDELARRAGVTKPVIYDLVGAKEELYRRSVTRAADELARRVSAAVTASDDPAARLRAGGLAFFGFVADRRRSWAVLFAEDAPAGAGGALEELRRRQNGLVAGLIAEAAGELGARPDPLMLDALAEALNGAYERLAHWWGEHPDVPAETLADWAAGLVLPGLEALATRR